MWLGRGIFLTPAESGVPKKPQWLIPRQLARLIPFWPYWKIRQSGVQNVHEGDRCGDARCIMARCQEAGGKLSCGALYAAFDREKEPTDLDIAQVLTDFVPLSKLFLRCLTMDSTPSFESPKQVNFSVVGRPLFRKWNVKRMVTADGKRLPIT